MKEVGDSLKEVQSALKRPMASRGILTEYAHKRMKGVITQDKLTKVHPSLAPESVTKRFLAACCALLALEAAPIFHGSAAATYATVFALLLPLLVLSFLAAVWLLRAMRDAQFSG